MVFPKEPNEFSPVTGLINVKDDVLSSFEEIAYIRCFGKIFNPKLLFQEYIASGVWYLNRDDFCVIESVRYKEKTIMPEERSLVRISREEYIEGLNNLLKSTEPGNKYYNNIISLLKYEEV